MYKHGGKRNIFRNKRGQFLILVSLGIVIMVVCLSLAIANTTISPLNFPKTRFRETAIQIYMNFKEALAIALAEVTKELSNKGYMSLSEYPAAANRGYEVLTEWMKTALLRYSSLGLNLDVSKPRFECNWTTLEGYSRAEANITMDILSYGLYNWKSRVIIELNLRIISLKNESENAILFFNLKDEYGAPITGLSKISMNVTDASALLSLTYYGNGNYAVNYNLSDSQPSARRIILQGPNGVIVGADFSTVPSDENDTIGPTATITITKTKYSKNETRMINITATISDIGRGSSKIVVAECYVKNARGENIVNVTMTPEDGGFDSPQEKVFAQLNITEWATGEYIIYVRGKDEAENWGDFTSKNITITFQGIHVKEITIKKESVMRWGRRQIRITVNVLVVDQDKEPVRGATVYGTWILRDNQGNEIQRTDVSDRTQGNGKVTFQHYVSANTQGSCTFIIRSLYHVNYPYDPDADEMKEVSITLP